MKKPSRFLRLLGAAALLATLLASVFATPMVYAGEPDPDPSDDGAIGDIWDDTIEPALQLGPGGIYFPWVGNDDESTGLGPADTSTSVMNLSDDPAVVFAFVGSHDTDELPATGSWDVVGPFFLAPWASKTFTAAELGIGEGTGAPVAFSGYNFLYTSGEEVICETNIGGPLEPGVDVNGNGECTDVEVLISGDDPGEPYVCEVDDANGDPTDTVGGDGLNADGDCVDAEGGNLVVGGDPVVVSTVLAGYAKQAVDGENLPYTTSADSSVSGYNSIGGFELGEFDNWYFPIAQTNCGPGGCWNSILRIANFGNVVAGEVGHIGSAAVTARFFPADDGSGSLATGFQLQALVNTGDVWEIDISDYVPEGWVGSVHVYSDSAIFAMVDRVKVGYGAWITNTASNAPWTNAANASGALGQYVLFAPDVRFDFFGWNTGINIANLVNDDNNVNVQYFNAFGNAPNTLTRRLAPQGMTYFYDPSIAAQDGSVQDPAADVNADIIGSALIWSDYPVAVAVDATKYPESTTSDDPNIFQAMSYSATGNVYTTQAFPLVQKGNPTTGMGATSGINIMNPTANAAQATVWWINPSGFGADNYGQSAVAIPGFANGFVYTMTQGNLPNGFYGSAVVNSTVPVAAVTTQVDYQVEWDGTAVWNGYNPCGYYRDNGAGFDCNFGDPFDQAGGQVTKYVADENGDPITGVLFRLANEAYVQQVLYGNESYPGIPWSAVGYSDISGEVEWTNVPEGEYRLIVEAVPMTDDNDLGDGPLPMYEVDLDIYGEVDGVYVSGVFQVRFGEDLEFINEFDRILATKIVSLGDDADDVPVCLVEAEDGGDVFDAVEDTEAVACALADEDGNVTFEDIEPGWYFVTVNYFFEVDGVDYDPVGGFPSVAFGPEFFGLGGVYVNDLDGDFNPAEGTLQKVLTFPAGVDVGALDINSIVTFFGPGGIEIEGGFQEIFLDGIGPNDEPSYSITDFNVPVGAYAIGEFITITGDFDNDPATPDDVFIVDEFIDRTDDQVICEDYLDASSDCEASPDAPEIVVYEDMVTRVFNDVAALVTGQLDIYVDDDDNDTPIDGAEVCLYDVANVLIECVTTGADGIASFNVPGGTYTSNASAAGFESEATTFDYDPFEDAANGGLADDAATADVAQSLDAGGAIMDVSVLGSDGVTGLENATVLLFPGNALDDPTTDFCADPTVQAIVMTDADGQAEFTVTGGAEYCLQVQYGLFIETIAPASVPAGDPNEEPGDADYPDFEVVTDADPVNVGILDILVNDTVQNTPPNFVEVYLASPLDVLGIGGACAGTLIASGDTVPNGVDTDGDGFLDGNISFANLAGNVTYCVNAEASDFFPGVEDVQQHLLPASDPGGDGDMTLNPA